MLPVAIPLPVGEFVDPGVREVVDRGLHHTAQFPGDGPESQGSGCFDGDNRRDWRGTLMGVEEDDVPEFSGRHFVAHAVFPVGPRMMQGSCDSR